MLESILQSEEALKALKNCQTRRAAAHACTHTQNGTLSRGDAESEFHMDRATAKDGRCEEEFQFKKGQKEKESDRASEMSINHNQRNKFSLVSLHVCSIKLF
jgi:hypothetical protein